MATMHCHLEPIVVLQYRPPDAQTQAAAQALGVRLVEHSHSVLHVWMLRLARRRRGTECAQQTARRRKAYEGTQV